MLLSVLYSLVFILFPDPQTPNFYSGLTSAREASKKSQKEMIIFFSDKTCSNCEAAWMAFTKDAEATKKFISTRMDRSDFDGGVFFDLLELQNTPSWVILNPDGTEKERWEGGWKDDSGNPTLLDTQSKISNSASQHKTVVQDTKPSITPPAAISSSPMQGGFYIQAGYFGSETNAKKMLDDLKTKEINSFEIKHEQKDGKTFYRVVSKMFATEMEAKGELQMLAAKGINASIKS